MTPFMLLFILKSHRFVPSEGVKNKE